MEYGLVVTKKNSNGIYETHSYRGNCPDLTAKKNFLLENKLVKDGYIFAYDEDVVRSAFSLMINSDVVLEKVKSLLDYDIDLNALNTVLEKLNEGDSKIINALYEDADNVCYEIMSAYNVAIRDCKVQLEYFGYKTLSKYAEDVGMSKKDARIVLYESFMESIASE